MATRSRQASGTADALDALSQDVWDKVVEDLERQGGVAVVSMPQMLEQVHANGFRTARAVLTSSSTSGESCSLPTIPPHADSAHVTGYHGAKGMSRYNMYREGLVFSDGHYIDSGDEPSLRPAMEDMFESLHGIAHLVLLALERAWGLPSGWFQQNMGPTRHHSQWHVKRYVEPDPTSDTLDTEPVVLLPVHTDPSLISVVIHDCSLEQDGAMGLEYKMPSVKAGETRPWVDVPRSGHAVATVLVGSALSYITGGIIKSAKHRVIQTSVRERMAATIFLRPRGTALLQVPPSAHFESVTLRREVDFHTWSARVARNYGKGKAVETNKIGHIKDGTSNGETDVFRDEHTELSLLACTPALIGKEKYLGGELGHNGKIYCVPGHASRVCVIDPSLEPPSVELIGPEFKGKFKWLRAVRMSTGIIYAIPCHADSVLRIDPETDTVSTLTWDSEDPMAPPRGLPWKWHGGSIAPSDGCLYCIPQFAEHVMKLDPISEELSFFGGPFPGRNKFYGGLLGKDGSIYGIPQNCSGVLRIDPTMQTATVHGDFVEGGYKWHGGIVGPDGCIYGIPAHADTVLRIGPGNPPQISTIGGGLRTGQHRMDGKYKFLGGAVGHDGCVYFFPSDADHVLQVNPATQEVREVGPNLRDLGSIYQNKWQNGFTSPDGICYGIPLKSSSIIRILTSSNGDPPKVTTIGNYCGSNKWEGAVMSRSGDIFCMPLNYGKVLRIKPLGLAC